MATYIARSATNKLFVVEDDEDGTASDEMVRLYNQGWTLYRVSSGGNGTFVLTPQRATGIVTTQVATDFTLEDDI